MSALSIEAIVDDQMKFWRNHSLFTILVAVLVTAGLGLAIVQASTMGVKMTMTGDADDAGSKMCNNCPDGGDGKAVACGAVCTVASFATMPEPLLTEPTVLPQRFAFLHAAPRDGPASTDPYPPKS